MTGNTPLTQLVEEWQDKNNTTYNQILLCISLELQMVIDDTDEAAAAWKFWLTSMNHMMQAKLVLCTPDMITITWSKANR